MTRNPMTPTRFAWTLLIAAFALFCRLALPPARADGPLNLAWII